MLHERLFITTSGLILRMWAGHHTVQAIPVLSHNSNDIIMERKHKPEGLNDATPLMETPQTSDHKRRRNRSSTLSQMRNDFKHPVSELPGLNHRDTTFSHESAKEQCLQDHKLDFRKRCARIEYHDTIEIEWALVHYYADLIKDKLYAAGASGKRRGGKYWMKFLRELAVDGEAHACGVRGEKEEI